METMLSKKWRQEKDLGIVFSMLQKDMILEYKK